MKKVFKNRLLKLAEFLRNLKRKQFYFGDFIAQHDECGTVACAVGWCPTVFPRHWKTFKEGDNSYYPSLSEESVPLTSAERFFDLTFNEAYGLFYPDTYRPWAEGELSQWATPKQVAKNIEDFVAWKEAQHD